MAVLKTFDDGANATLTIQLSISGKYCMIKINDVVYMSDSEDISVIITELQYVKKQIDNNIENL